MSVLDKTRYTHMVRFNRSLLFDGYEQVDAFLDATRSQDFISNLFYGDYTNWIISLMYLPLRIRAHTEIPRSINIGGKIVDSVKCYGLSRYYERTYYINSIRCSEYVQKRFEYFEPYCSCEIYLPYFGKCTVPMWIFHEKNFLNFYLSVDLVTGHAKYVITASDNRPSSDGTEYAVEIRNIEYYYLPDDEYFISEYAFNIGYAIPVNSTGEADRRTSLAISGLSAAATIASAVATGGIAPIATTVATGVVTETTKQPSKGSSGLKTNAVKTTETKTTTTRTGEKPPVVDTICTSIQGSLQFLNSLELKGNSNNAQLASMYTSTTKDIIITIVRKEFRYLSGVLYGSPCGRYVDLDILDGYAKISNIRFDNFTGTQTELFELKNLLTSGVYFN